LPQGHGLPKESVINVTQIATIDKNWVKNRVGTLPQMLMEEVDYGIGMVLGLHF